MTSAGETARPRVLFISFNVKYFNPTREMFAKALAGACDLTCYGPGYASPEEVAAGPEAFVERHGPFDLVVADEYSALREEIPDDKKHLHKFYFQASHFDPLLIHEGTRYFRFLKSYRGPRVISMMCSDYQNLSEDFVEQICEIGDYFAGWGNELICRKKDIELRYPGPQNSEIYRRWTDRYYEFTTANAARFISVPHFVGDDEIGGGPLSSRRFHWSIMGADYESRMAARTAVDGAKLKRSGKVLPYALSAAQQAGLHIYNKHWAIFLMQLAFRRAILAARYGYTCGGACQWPIRKYFEIPAYGAVLAAERCTGWSELGFIDRVNAVETSPERILDDHRWLESDLSRAQEIAGRGRALVAEKHSVTARSQQLAEALGRIKAGKFAGAHWADGQLIFA